MGGGDLNTKKSWHPNTLKNQGRVWAAERAAEQERTRIEELRRERGGERARDELRALGRSAGTLPGAGSTDTLSWMYTQPNKSGDTEDYLLGKTIDKSYERLVAEDKTAAPPKNHVEHEVIPFSIRQLRGGLAASVPDTQVDMARKLQEDPLAAIQRRELEARAQLLQNPLRLQQLHKLLRADQEKRKEKKDKKKSKKNKSNLDAVLAEKLSGLQGKKIDLASLLSGDKKKKKKNKKPHSDSDSKDSSEDEKLKKRKKKCKDTESQEEKPKKLKKRDPDSDSNDDSSRKKRHKHTATKEERSRNKKHLDSDSNDDLSKKKRHKHTVTKEERSLNKKRLDPDSNGNSSRRKEHRNSPDREELTRNLKKKLQAITSHLENRYAIKAKRPDSNEEEENRRKHRRDSSDSEGIFSKSKKKFEKDRHTEANSSKSKSSRDLDEKLTKKKRKHSSTEDDQSPKKSKVKSHRKARSPTPKTKSHRERSESPRVKHCRNSSSDSDAERKPKHFGLVSADGRKLTTSKSSTEVKPPTKKEDTWKRPVVEKLSREEKEKRLREMVSAAEERNVERERNLRRHRETARREEAAASSEFDPEFATRQAARAAGGTVQDRIRSNVYNIQRSDRHMDVNFAKR